MSDGFSWFQSPGRTPQLSDLDHKPFFRRHFWPPSAGGIVVLSLLAAVLVGFLGAVIYTSSDNARIEAVDPADESRVAPTLPPDTSAATTTSKPVEILDAGGIAKKAGPSVWTVTSLDTAGRPVEGVGFVAGSFGGQTYLLTSLSIVEAATRVPGPEVVARNGGADVKATLWTWHEERDLALLALGRTAPSLNWADQNPAAKTGDKVFVMPGGGGGALTGTITGISPAGVQHNVPVEERHVGAPLMNDRGQVLGVLARTPGGVGVGGLTVLPMSAACERVLSCGSGNTVVPEGGETAAASTTTTVARSSLRPTTTVRR